MSWLPLKRDFVFRAVFGRENTDSDKVLTYMLNDMLNLDISSLKFRSPEKVKDRSDGKRTAMDVHVTTSAGELIDIEIQLRNVEALNERMVYYGSRLMQESLNEKDDYPKMRKCKVVCITDFSAFPDFNSIQHNFVFKERKYNFELTDVFEIIFLDMSKVPYSADVRDLSALERWLYFIRYSDTLEDSKQMNTLIRESEGIKMAVKVLEEVSSDEKMRSELLSAEKHERDQISREATAYNAGETDASDKIALNMLRSGYLDDDITQMTGVSYQRLSELKIAHNLAKSSSSKSGSKKMKLQ